MNTAIPVSSTAQVLRPYQREAVDAVKAAWAEGQIPLIWAATGAGKTTMFSQLLVETVDPACQRGLVFAHTKEIIEQTATRIANQYGELVQPYYGPRFAPGIGVVMGEKDSPDARIVVATRQSLHAKRMARVLERWAI
jgi:superfamily II DNA or RNA helicase